MEVVIRSLHNYFWEASFSLSAASTFSLKYWDENKTMSWGFALITAFVYSRIIFERSGWTLICSAEKMRSASIVARNKLKSRRSNQYNSTSVSCKNLRRSVVQMSWLLKLRRWLHSTRSGGSYVFESVRDIRFQFADQYEANKRCETELLICDTFHLNLNSIQILDIVIKGKQVVSIDTRKMKFFHAPHFNVFKTYLIPRNMHQCLRSLIHSTNTKYEKIHPLA